MALSGKVCLVTGASRGIGKGIAVQLGEAGATVYVTGRGSSEDSTMVGGTLKETATEITARGGKGIPLVCDHSKDDQIKSVFETIKKDQGKLDVLVNNAYSAVNALMKQGQAGHMFWEIDGEPGEWWDTVNNVGLRNHYICSTYAAQMMTEAKQGLIVNISSFGGISYLFNVAYGVGKAAVDRMSADMAIEMKKHNVACVTLYPGPVMTEHIDNMMKGEEKKGEERMSKFFKQSETPEFSGRSVVHLAKDPKIMEKSGRIVIAAELGQEYGFTDINGSQPPTFRRVNLALARAGHTWIAACVPDFIKIPAFLISMRSSKF